MNVWWRSVSEYVYGLLYSVDLSSALTCTYITQTHTWRHELALTPKTEIETAENVRSRKKRHNIVSESRGHWHFAFFFRLTFSFQCSKCSSAIFFNQPTSHPSFAHQLQHRHHMHQRRTRQSNGQTQSNCWTVRVLGRDRAREETARVSKEYKTNNFILFLFLHFG